MRDALALPAWVVGFSFIGIGSLAREVGHPVTAAVLSTILVWASPAQVLLYGGLAAGVALPAIAAAVCLSSLRFLPMAISLLPLLRRPGQGLAAQALLAHPVSVTIWIEGQRRLPPLPPEERIPYYVGFSYTAILVSAGLTFVGYFLAGAVPGALAAALLFLAPLFFSISLVAGARAPADWTAIALGFGLAPLSTLAVGGDVDLLATGLVGGTAAYLVGRLRRPRA
jgi:predicted branched-subunit amino acid permease